MGRKLNSTQKREALQRLAAGQFQTEVAAEFGVSKSTICKFANKQESREFIEKESKRMLESLPDIIEARMIGVQISLKLAKYFAGQDDPDAKAIVDRIKVTTTMKMLSKRDKRAMRQTLKENKTPALQLFEILSRQSSDYLRAVGILPSQSPSFFIKNVYQDNRKQVFSPRVLEMLGKFGASLRLPENDPTQGPQPQDVVSEHTQEG